MIDQCYEALWREDGQQTTLGWTHALPTRTPLNHCPTFCVHDCFCWGSPFVSSSLTSWFSGPFCWSWEAPLVSIAASCPWGLSFAFSTSIFSAWAASCFFSTREAEATVIMPWMFTLTFNFTFCDSPSAVGWTSLICHWPGISYLNECIWQHNYYYNHIFAAIDYYINIPMKVSG